VQAYFAANLLSNPDLVDEVGYFLLRHTGNDKDFLPTRLSYLLNLTGPSVAVQTACSTGLVAVHMGIGALLAMECDMAIAGGVTIELPHRVGYRYEPGEILAPDGVCRAFDGDSQGTVFGSGVGIVVLRRLQDALDDNDDIKAVILGSAINNDGARKVGYLAPSCDGQAAAAIAALAVAGVAAASVTYVEAHGTGTPIGDPIELAALTQAYRSGGRQFCGIGSVKTNIGHLDTAAGTAGLIKVIEALRHREIPASLNYRTPNARFDLDASPFYVVERRRHWPRGPTPRRAAVHAVGVGGTNAHVIVEEAPDRPAPPAAPQWCLLPFSARTRSSLASMRAKWQEFAAGAMPPLSDVAFTLRHGRRRFDTRLALAARTPDDVRAALAGKAPWLVHEGCAGDAAPQVVLLFPGGGAQHPGAGADLLRDQPVFAAAVAHCLDGLVGSAPADLREVMFARGSDDAEATRKLGRSAYAIPALFVLEYAYARLLQHFGVRPAAILAHSVGEYAGAVIAGVLDLTDALRIVALRGQVMDAAPAGAMTMVPAGEAEVRALIGDALDIAAINAPQACVVSGTLAATEALEARLAGTEHECKRIRIDVASHSRVLDGQLDRFRRGFAGVRFAPPQVPMLSSLRGDWARDEDLVTAEYWVRHLRHTVRFSAAVAKVLERPHQIVLEVGPGQTLSALVAMASAAHPPQAIVAAARRPTDAANDTGVLLAACGALWAHGVELAWEHLPGANGRRVSLPTYAFAKERHWIEPGRGSAAPADDALQFDRLPDMADWCEEVQWRDAPLPPPGDAATTDWLVFAGNDPWSRELLAALAAMQARVTQVQAGPAFARAGEHFVLRPGVAEDCEALVTALGHLPRRVVYLWSLVTGREQELCFDAVFSFARAVVRHATDALPRIAFVTAGVFAADAHGVTDVEAATLAGMAAVLPREVPGLEAAVVDLDPTADARAGAHQVLLEAMAAGGLPACVAWRGERRLLPRRWRSAAPLPTGLPPRLRRGGVYVITGGTGGIGRALAHWLAEAAQARVALFARQARHDNDLATRLAAAGGEAMFVAVDVADRHALRVALDGVRQRWGTIHGVFHAAGVLDDGPLAGRTLAQARTVMAPKIVGGRNLAALLPVGSLDLFAVFSSSSVALGPPGQADYVASNAWLEALAASRADGLAIAWGVWRDLGMAERAYGIGVDGESRHPLLGMRQDTADGVITFTRRFDPATDWVLAEHMISGQPLLPATAYVEIAIAAARAVTSAPAVDVRGLTLTEPLVFGNRLPRLVVVRLTPQQTGYELVIESRAGTAAPTVEHARARLQANGPLSEALPLSLLRQVEAPRVPSPRSERAPNQDRLHLGPRWHNAGALRTGSDVATGEYALPVSFVGDLEHYLAHPALLDMAATVGMELLVARGEQRLYAPIACERVRWFAPLPRELTSRAVLVADVPGRLAAFDVVLHDRGGRVIVIVERLAMRAVPDDAFLAPAGTQARLADVLLARGIRASDAPALFARVLAHPARHLVVSSVPLDQVRLAMAASRPSARPARNGIAERSLDPPRNAVEQQLAAAWSELLGVATVGRGDDFFALGGHSLHAVRMLARLRKDLGIDLPLAALFEAPTLAAVAARVVAQRPELLHPAAASPSVSTPSVASTAVASVPDAAAVPGPAEYTIASTAAQREIFAAILIDPGTSRAYNLSFSWHLEGDLHAAHVAAACAALVARHESLRATFSADGLRLRIQRTLPWGLAQLDLAAPASECAARLRAFHAEAVAAPFDLASGPLFRATLVRLADARHELVFVVHHIVCDGWSIGVLMRDFQVLLNAQRDGNAARLPAAVGVSEFVAAETAWQAGPQAPVHRTYWLARFAAAPPAIELPTDQPRPPVKTTRAAHLDDAWSPALDQAIRTTAQSLGASLQNFVFAAFQLYVGRLTGNHDVVIGLPAAGQLAHGLDGVVGHCVNFLPILSRLTPEQTFAAFLREVRGTLAAALDHQHYAYGALVRDLRLRRDPARAALVPVIFNIDNLTAINALTFTGLRTRFTMNPRAHEHFEWFVNLLEEPGRVVLSWNYNAELFTATTMAGHLARFRLLLHGLAQAPDTKLGDVGRLLTPSVRPASGSLLDPGAAGPQAIPTVFAAVVRRYPERCALRFGTATMSYATLAARTDALAALLAQRGVRPGDLVGIAARRGFELVIAVLGTLKAGAGYVPFDTSLPSARLAFMAHDTSVKLLLGECKPVTAAGVPTIAFAEFPTAAAAAPAVAVTGESVAYVMFTSGTTGQPKGVVLPHRSVIRMLVDTDWLTLGPATVTLHSSAFAFDTSVIDLFAALLHGGTVVIPPHGQLSLSQLADAIAGYGVNTLWLTAGLFHAIADLRPDVFAAVGQLIVGGDVVSPVQVRKVMDRCPRVRVINGYGPTESNVTNAHAIARTDLTSGQALPIGRAVPGTQVWIVDAQLNPVEPGVQGELCISGRGLALGYHNRPELTAQKFVAAPWDARLRLYRTGDLALDPGDGVIRFLGRMDSQVKIRGFRVELGEVEAVLASQPRIRQAVVVAVLPPGQPDRVLAAHLVPHGAAPERGELDEWVRQRLPEYARPHLYKITASIPLNHNGKVDRAALPPVTAADVPAHRADPVGVFEVQIAAIWADLLGLPRIGADLDFFELGGHSLLAVRLFDRLRQVFGVELPISTLLQHPTVRALAGAVAAASRAPSLAVDVDGDWDTSVVVHPGPVGPRSEPRWPLFIVGGAGGNVNNLYEVGRSIGRQRPVIGFQTRGILGHAPRASIEVMAAEHARYLRRHQPKGPYVIAGYSGGALTAFEMARQLMASGESVLELFIFDTFAPGFARDFRPSVKMSPLQRLRIEFDLLRKEGPGFFFERLSARVRSTVLRGPMRRLAPWFTPEMNRVRQVEDSWRAAAAVYVGGPFAGFVTLLQAEPRALMSRLALKHDPTLGWGEFVAAERLTRMPVPGDHLRMIRGEHAVALAAIIEDRLRDALARDATRLGAAEREPTRGEAASSS
jgi:amino acid adenylation domain-containing protein